MPRRWRLAALSSDDTEKKKAELIANTETMSILLSNANTQRPEVQELRHSTKVTFHEKRMYVHGNFEAGELRCAYTCIYMNMYICVYTPGVYVYVYV